MRCGFRRTVWTRFDRKRPAEPGRCETSGASALRHRVRCEDAMYDVPEIEPKWCITSVVDRDGLALIEGMAAR